MGVEGKMIYFILAIAFGKGVVKAMPYTVPINGVKFIALVDEHFASLLQACKNPQSCLFLQDGNKLQNTKVSKNTLDCMGLKVFPIPPKSPDANPIENVFHLVGKEIKEEGRTLGITR